MRLDKPCAARRITLMRPALRALLRTPGFTITALLFLALAIGASAAALAVIDAVPFRALLFLDGGRLVLVSEIRIGDGVLDVDQVADQRNGVRTNATQILAFAAVGLFLALLGVHGALAYAVGERAREIGIRGALVDPLSALRFT